MDSTRVDKWLWAARCHKTRTQATSACDAGHIEVNGMTAKPSRQVRPGDIVKVSLPERSLLYRVVAIGERRGPASEARTLFEDLTPPEPVRPCPPVHRDRGAGRPTKRDRRLIQRLLEDGDDSSAAL